MRLSWNEIRARAAKFSEEWENAHYEKGETQSFYNDFFQVFDVKRRRVATFEQQIRKLSNTTGFIDLFWPSVLLVEQKSEGVDLDKAYQQAQDYGVNLKPEEHPRYILVSDFQNFGLYDLEERDELHFLLADLHKHVEAFGFITGVQKRVFRDQDPVNIKASNLMARVHDGLAAGGYGGHDLEQFLVRLVFCLFADDTGIFERDILLDYLQNRTQADGSDLGGKLAELFQVLNTPEDTRQSMLDEDLAAFPYVNGELFCGALHIPAFNSTLRDHLITACLFDWGKVSPAIFGSLFQGVMDAAARRQEGAHYTNEQNILKVIEPLFMDDLRAEFSRIKQLKTKRKERLRAFQQKLGQLSFFDPACGCGNFLVIAYRELRQLEIEVLQAIYPHGQQELDVATLSQIDVDQFYGIEIGEFAARIAETALWMMDHIMNNKLSLSFGQSFARIPLEKSPHILHADALETDWSVHLPANKCDYVFGNPPFGGFVFKSAKKQEQMQRMSALGAIGLRLDYVTAWFLKAGDYVQMGKAKIAFVATNSITQGEQVAQLWPALFDRYKLEIAFAHRTFAWESEARGKAHVHVVIIGLTRADMEPKEKRLFSYADIKGVPEESHHAALTAYLFGVSNKVNNHRVIEKSVEPINNFPILYRGTSPVDDGNYILTKEECKEFLAKEPNAEILIHPYIGAQEYLNSEERYFLNVQSVSSNILSKLPEVKKRIALVRNYRLHKGGKLAKSLAETPRQYHRTNIPQSSFLVLPRVSSERREYVPFGWLEPPVIPSDAVQVLSDATLSDFALLTSAMHMAWLRHIGGRLESRYRYSVGIVYNTFPMPPMTERQKAAIGSKAQTVLDARTAHKGATLATLYDPDLMPSDLRRAHTALDKAVDRLYRKTPFTSERERVEHLFTLYEQMTSPLTAPRKKRRKRQEK